MAVNTKLEKITTYILKLNKQNKQGELLDLSVFPDEVRNAVDDNWGEPVSMENDFSIEEILDMPTEGNFKEPNYIEADNESHGGKIPCGLFCVTGKDSELIDIDSIFDNDKMVI